MPYADAARANKNVGQRLTVTFALKAKRSNAQKKTA
jgi:hypothetical protein